ncbi:Fic family protein [Oceanobacillus sojae]|uniref:Fic family protein n=1 Tax=Oceanobacillus sojae TaxID=582851 RepID=UPI0021A888B7|nr:Fic family protein [Oceanobacillus sojae]MCT1902970.1 Fic family protein [Oceanobacillus sojae]
MKKKLLNKSSVLKEQLDKKRPLPYEVVKDMKEDFYIKNTYHSNAIEGNTLTLYETKAVLEDGITIQGKSFREHAEANNHKEAIEYVEELINDNVPLSQRTMKDIHAIVMQGIDRTIAGKYRNTAALITGANHTPPSHEKIQDEMDNLMDWYEKNNDLHPVEKASLLHAKIVNIHPFSDGNGRTSRLLMNFELMKAGFPPITIEKDDRFRYYEVLDISGTKGDYEPFILFTAEREVDTLENYLEFLKDL